MSGTSKPVFEVIRKSGKRRLTFEIEVGAPPEAVWKALTEADELSRWFPTEARITPGEGGKLWLSWGAGCEGEGPIHLWEPERRFGWQEMSPGGTLAVEWEIEGRGGKSLVRLVHSGFGEEESWDGYIDALERGWTYFLHNLGHYLEHHRGRPRAMVSRREPREEPQANTWRRLMGPQGLAVTDAGPAPAEGTTGTLRLGDRTLAARILIHREPWAFAAVLPELDQALLFVEMESGAPKWHCGIWLSTYGLPDDRVAALRAQLDALSGAVFAN